jgi:hypothetical protein
MLLRADGQHPSVAATDLSGFYIGLPQAPERDVQHCAFVRTSQCHARSPLCSRTAPVITHIRKDDSIISTTAGKSQPVLNLTLLDVAWCIDQHDHLRVVVGSEVRSFHLCCLVFLYRMLEHPSKQLRLGRRHSPAVRQQTGSSAAAVSSSSNYVPSSHSK